MAASELRRALQFFPSKAADRTRNDAAAATALVVAYWLDDEETFRAVRVGDMRATAALEGYVRDHADEALGVDRGRDGGIILPWLGGYGLDMDFQRITTMGGQAEHYDPARRQHLLNERETLMTRLRAIEAMLR